MVSASPKIHEILRDTVNKRGGTHPTGMFSCLKTKFKEKSHDGIERSTKRSFHVID